MLPDNLLFLEPLLLATLRAELPPHVHVKPIAEINVDTKDRQPAPTVYVMYLGMQVDRAGAEIESTQRWVTLVAMRNQRDLDGGHDARQDAGVLAMQVIDALNGRRFAPAHPLTAATPPAPWYMDGHYYLPLLWSAPLLIWRDLCRD